MIDGMSILVTVVGEWKGIEFKVIQVSSVRVNIHTRLDLWGKGDRGGVDTNRWADERRG